MTYVYPLFDLDGRLILAEWTLVHPEQGRMLIRLWDGNSDVHVLLGDEAHDFGIHPAHADSYDHGYRQVVSEVIPGYQAEGWTVTEAELADDIDAPDAEFAPARCPACRFGTPWWTPSDEACQVCDTAADLDILPWQLDGHLDKQDFSAARTTLTELATTIATARQVLDGLDEADRPEDITGLLPEAVKAHRQAVTRLDAVASCPNYTETAATAVLAAVANGSNIPEWLAHVLATAAAQLGSTWALLATRPGSWEADCISQLLAGTVGPDDENLADFAPADATETDSPTSGQDRPAEGQEGSS